MSVAYEAMMFARLVHKDQVRKYTGNPYVDHLAEVAGIVASVTEGGGKREEMIAVAWLHDTIEDQGVSYELLCKRFGHEIAHGVLMLSDIEKGNRATHKALSRLRLAGATPWVQTIKVADLISNTSSIVKHDPKFAAVYLQEKAAMLDILIHADHRLRAIAWQQVDDGRKLIA